MGYRDLVDNVASRTKIQTYLAQGGLITTIIRIPANLRDTITEEATLQGMSTSAYLRQCVIMRLANSRQAEV